MRLFQTQADVYRSILLESPARSNIGTGKKRNTVIVISYHNLSNNVTQAPGGHQHDGVKTVRGLRVEYITGEPG